MKCETARETLALARYEESPHSAVEDHLQSCEACRAFRESSAALDALLDSDETTEPRPGFDTRFFARLEDEKQDLGRSWFVRWFGQLPRWALAGFATSAVTAAVVVLVVPGVQQAGGEGGMESEMALALELELLEDYEVVNRLAEVEAFELLAQVDLAELDAALREGVPQ